MSYDARAARILQLLELTDGPRRTALAALLRDMDREDTVQGMAEVAVDAWGKVPNLMVTDDFGTGRYPDPFGDEGEIVVRPSATRPTEHVLVFLGEWSLSVPWDDIPSLITKLRRAYNSRPTKGAQ